MQLICGNSGSVYFIATKSHVATLYRALFFLVNELVPLDNAATNNIKLSKTAGRNKSKLRVLSLSGVSLLNSAAKKPIQNHGNNEETRYAGCRSSSLAALELLGIAS